MNKDTIFSILRIVLTIGGAILVGKNIGSTAIDMNWWQTGSGIVIALFSLVWSFKDQTSTLESFQATIMQAFLFVASGFLASGKISADDIKTWGGILTMIGALVYPVLSRKKSQAVASGKIPIEALKGVNEEGATQKPITPVLNVEPPK